MYEYHGWLTISTNTYEEDDVILLSVVTDIRKFIEQLSWVTGKIEIYAVNGQFHLHMSGFDNHKPTGSYIPNYVFEHIGNKAKGSYGMLYIRDNDDGKIQNSFKVYVMARGQVVEREDMYLLPCNPTIED